MQTVKCVVVGNAAVGKTCMLKSFTTTKEFLDEYIPTMSDNYDATVTVGDRPCKLALFDTSGVEELDRIRRLSYPDTNVVLVCFSVISPSSYDMVQEKWVSEITHNCPGVPFLLVGTMVDLRDDPGVVERLANHRLKPVSREMGEKLARKVKAVKYVECSVRRQWQVKDVFDEAICAALEPAPTAESKSRKCLLL